jgi:hypothetical protein
MIFNWRDRTERDKPEAYEWYRASKGLDVMRGSTGRSAIVWTLDNYKFRQRWMLQVFCVEPADVLPDDALLIDLVRAHYHGR